MITIASIQDLPDGRVAVQLADKRGVVFDSRAELDRVRKDAQNLPLEALIALAVPPLKRDSQMAIGKDIESVEIKPKPTEPTVEVKL